MRVYRDTTDGTIAYEMAAGRIAPLGSRHVDTSVAPSESWLTCSLVDHPEYVHIGDVYSINGEFIPC